MSIEKKNKVAVGCVDARSVDRKVVDLNGGGFDSFLWQMLLLLISRKNLNSGDDPFITLPNKVSLVVVKMEPILECCHFEFPTIQKA